MVDSSRVALEDLPLGEKEATEGLSGRGLEMSRFSWGLRELPESLPWRPLLVEPPGEEAFRVGMTAAWGVTTPEGDDAEPEGDRTTGAVVLVADDPLLVDSEPDPRRFSEVELVSSPDSPTLRHSPMDMERDILAMELVVGLM